MFWLYSDDTLIKVTGRREELKARVRGVLEIVSAFGLWSGLRVNMVKTELMLRGTLPQQDWMELKVVPYIRYLGAFIGTIDADRSFAPAMSKVWQRCCWLASAPLSLEEKKLLVHSWVLPCLRVPGLVRAAPMAIKLRLRAAVRMAFNVKPWRLSSEILSLPPGQGGIGLVKPDIYMDWLLAKSLWRWVQDESFLPMQANMLFKEWVNKRGLFLQPRYLPLLVLAGSPKSQVPWVVAAVEAWSRLMVQLPGVAIPHTDLLGLPLWHNKVFSKGSGTRACHPLIANGYLMVAHWMESKHLVEGAPPLLYAHRMAEAQMDFRGRFQVLRGNNAKSLEGTDRGVRH